MCVKVNLFIMLAIVAGLLLAGCAGPAASADAGAKAQVKTGDSAQTNAQATGAAATGGAKPSDTKPSDSKTEVKAEADAQADIKIPDADVKTDVEGAMGAETGQKAEGAMTGEAQADAKAQILEFLRLKGASGWTAWYNLKAVTNGEAVAPMKTVMYFKAADNLRTDVTASGVDSRIYIKSDGYYSCFQLQGSWMCTKVGQSQESAADKVEKGLLGGEASYKVTAKPGRTIAGAATSCFEIVASEPVSTTDFCYTAKGALLYSKTVGSQDGRTFESELEATKYVDSVSEADLTLPAQPGAAGGFPGLPGGYAGGSAGAYGGMGG